LPDETGTIALQSNLGNRNLIINGDMQVAQRGTTSTEMNGYTTVDQLRVGNASGGITTSQRAVNPDTVPNDATVWDLGFRRYVRLTNDTIPTVATNSLRRFMLGRLEAQDIANSGWDYENPNSFITFSCWFRASEQQDYMFFIRTHDGTAQQYHFAVTIDGTNEDEWVRVEHSIPGNANLTFDNDNEIGWGIEIAAWYGTDFTAAGVAAETWADFDNDERLPDMDTAWRDQVNATMDLTGVQLEVGSFATSFEHRTFVDELARCQRYYFQQPHGLPNVLVIYPAQTANIVGATATSTGASIGVSVPIMRIDNPTIRLAGDGTFTSITLRTATGGLLATANAWPTFNISNGMITIAHASANTSNVGQIRIGGNDGPFTFSAEL